MLVGLLTSGVENEVRTLVFANGESGVKSWLRNFIHISLNNVNIY